MASHSNDALTAAHAWLREWHICPHDVPIAEPCCPTCAASLASVIDGVARARVDAQRVPTPAVVEPMSEVERLRGECAALIDRLHVGLDVMADTLFDEPGTDDLHERALRQFRVAVLKVARDYLGDPEAEEVLAREGHDVG